MTLSLGLIGIMLLGVAGLLAIAAGEKSCDRPEPGCESKAAPGTSPTDDGLRKVE